MPKSSQSRPEFTPYVIDMFPFVCANAMPDQGIQDLQDASRTKGFGVGPEKRPFKALVPTNYIHEPQTTHSGRELLLRALNHQHGVDTGDAHGYVPPIAARLTACLYVLTMSSEMADYLIQKGASAMAQLQLSALLVAYPVLMHPKMLFSCMSFLNEATRTALLVPEMSIPYAIALAEYARLPMVKDGISVEQLTEFANNRCTKLGLRAQSVPLLSVGFPSKGTRTPLGMSFGMSKIRPELIASLHELSRLTVTSPSQRATAVKNNPGHCNPASDAEPGLFSHLEYEPVADSVMDPDFVHNTPKFKSEGPVNPMTSFSYLKDDTVTVFSSNFSHIYTASFIAACGVGGKFVFGKTADINMGEMLQETRIPTPEFLSAFRDMRLYENIDVAIDLRKRVVNRIFFNEANLPNTDAQVAQAVHLIVDGLVSGGVAKNTSLAAAWLLDRIRKDNLPWVDMECVMAFIRSLDQYGAKVDTKLLESPIDTHSVTDERRDLSNQIRTVWRDAARIQEMEKLMAGTIERARVENAGDSVDVDNDVAESDVASRRPRMRI